MSDIVNLNKRRKKKLLAEKTARAEQNRAKFGRTKAEKTRAKKEEDLHARHIDGHKTDDASDA